MGANLEIRSTQGAPGLFQAIAASRKSHQDVLITQLDEGAGGEKRSRLTFYFGYCVTQIEIEVGGK